MRCQPQESHHLSEFNGSLDTDAPLHTHLWEICTRGLRYADTPGEKAWAIALFPICLLCIPVVLLWTVRHRHTWHTTGL
jgi:hypothetical protein